MKFWKNLFWKSIGSCEWRKLVGGTDGAPMAARWWATNRPKRPPFQLLFAKAKLDWQLDVSIMVARGWMSLAGIMWNLCRAELTGRIGCASVGCLAAVVDANWIGSWFLRRRSSARRWRGQLSNRFTWRCHPLCSHQPPVCASVSTKDLCVACQTPLNCVVRHQWKQCHFASTSFATDPLFIGHGRWHFECDAICTGRHRQPVAKLTWIEIEVSSRRWSSPHVGPPLKRNRNAIAIPLANPISQCHSPVAHQSSGRWLHKAPARKRTSTDTVISAHPMQITTQMNHYRTPPKSGLSCKKKTLALPPSSLGADAGCGFLSKSTLDPAGLTPYLDHSFKPNNMVKNAAIPNQWPTTFTSWKQSEICNIHRGAINSWRTPIRLEQITEKDCRKMPR